MQIYIYMYICLYVYMIYVYIYFLHRLENCEHNERLHVENAFSSGICII